MQGTYQPTWKRKFSYSNADARLQPAIEASLVDTNRLAFHNSAYAFKLHQKNAVRPFSHGPFQTHFAPFTCTCKPLKTGLDNRVRPTSEVGFDPVVKRVRGVIKWQNLDVRGQIMILSLASSLEQTKHPSTASRCCPKQGAQPEDTEELWKA